MATQYQQARAGNVTAEMRRVARREHLPAETIRDELAAGRLVIPANRLHLAGSDRTGVKLDPIGIGRAVTTKINANIGASPDASCAELELTKLRWALCSAPDALTYTGLTPPPACMPDQFKIEDPGAWPTESYRHYLSLGKAYTADAAKAWAKAGSPPWWACAYQEDATWARSRTA